MDSAVTAVASRDTDLERRVSNLLWSRPALRDVSAIVEDGRALLRGNVETFYQKQLCLSGAQRVPGIFRVVDNIAVGLAPRSTADVA